ncbi:hypothetical protein CSC3H3_00530 [Thalassospira marina]|uniref:Solute-binding protein family 3/N-terminal domain-containing protein n=1 Tax=Thalassospira marina TaxID=2048283 RepID=A0ABM6Q4G2_9PROT|nr:hypothetical protein CSC3H3_00530 [Thalassospira marina]
MDAFFLRIFVFVAVIFMAIPARAQQRPDVMVGVYEYSVVHFYHDGVETGFAHDLVERLNRIQGDFHFVTIETSSRRRYEDMATGKMDMLLLQNPDWNWAGRGVDFSTPIVWEHDILVARRDHVPGPGYFHDVLEHSIAGVLGYHYRFAGFMDDPRQLTRLLNISLLYNESEVLEAVIRDDAEVGVLSAGFMSRKFRQVADMGDRVAMGPRADNSYPLAAAISRRAPITVDRFNRYLDDLRAENQIAPLWSRWHRGVLP